MKRITVLFLACLLTLNLFGCSKKIDPAAQLVMDEITELTESNEVDLAGLEKTKERYNSLTDEQKNQITNYADLLKLEDEYEKVVQEAIIAEQCYEGTGFKKIEYATTYAYKNAEQVDTNWINYTFSSESDAYAAFDQYNSYLKSTGYSRSGAYNDVYTDENGNKIQVTKTNNTLNFRFNDKTK